MRKTKNAVLMLSALLALLQCGRKGSQVEKITENGIEVVINHLEPYLLPGVPSTLRLEEILSIDTEKDEVLKTGMSSMEWFCLDRDGNIYFMMRQSPENFLYKFDRSGKFLISFGRKGQGPGEFEWGGDILVDEYDHIIANDMSRGKFFVFDRSGVLLEEIKPDKNYSLVKYLRNGKYLTYRQEMDPVEPVYRNHYYLSNASLSENHELYAYESEDRMRTPRWRPQGHAFILSASAENICFGDSSQGYEIFVFDFSGKLQRKIRKEFRPVAFPDDYKAMLKKVYARNPIGQELLKKANFPAYLPPFRYLFADDQGRLYVMTNEREGERSYWYDIFNAEGAFIGRFRLDNVQVTYSRGERYYDEPTDVVVRGDRLYCLREKDSGFKILTIYKMIWS